MSSTGFARLVLSRSVLSMVGRVDNSRNIFQSNTGQILENTGYWSTLSPNTDFEVLPHLQVTFGDSDGRFDTQAGSLTLGWSVQHHITGGGGEHGNKALQGTNAVVCAAGAGPLPSVTAAAARPRDLGNSLISAIEGIDLPNLKDVERQVRG